MNHKSKAGEKDKERGVEEENTHVADVAIVVPLVVEEFDHNRMP